VLSWMKGSGADVPSTHYLCGKETVNCGAVGTFMRTAVVSENRIVPIGPETALREAALFGCAVPTGAGIAINTLRVRPGESVAIFGVGGIGLSAVLGAALLHAYPIVAVDVRDHKLDYARSIGATHGVNASAPEAAAVSTTPSKRPVELRPWRARLPVCARPGAPPSLQAIYLPVLGSVWTRSISFEESE
jgi:S-(hydroxymethyl)glutathione dehydrogenase / alcohol dehydrogenase